MLCVWCTSCDRADKDADLGKTDEEMLEGNYLTNHYVPAYFYDLDSFVIRQFVGAEQTKYGDGIILDFKGKSCNEETNKEKYVSLASLYGDMTFTQSSQKGKRHILPEEISIADPIASISVVSDQDFDDAHPAGTKLDDILYFHAISPYVFVKSHYTTWNDDTPSLIDGGYSTIEGKLTDMKAEDFLLINCSFSYPAKAIYIDFPEKPTAKTHHLTISIAFTNGKVLTAYGTKEFE